MLRSLNSHFADGLPLGLTRLALAALVFFAGTGCAVAQRQAPETPREDPVAKPTDNSKPGTGSAVERDLPVVLEARTLNSQLDLEMQAEGDVVLRRGDLVLKADRLSYKQTDGLAEARGRVSIERDGNLFSGPELRLYVPRFEGEFLSPTYFFSRTGAGGKADRVDFLDQYRSHAVGGTYSSCRADDPEQTLAWQLSARSLDLDFDTGEGVAKGAVLRFYGVPILAAPSLSFPLGDQRMSGWLPPNLNLDSLSGAEFGMPYYWNIAPQRDATLTPKVITRRGVGLDSEFRYLTPRERGEVKLDLLPNDRIAGGSRWDLNLHHSGLAPLDWRYSVNAERVSDVRYWNDFPHGIKSLTPRLLATDLRGSRGFNSKLGELTLYGRMQQWQVLQNLSPSAVIAAPYQRSPQLGARWSAELQQHLDTGLELEYNRFDLPREASPAGLPTGSRVHALAHLGWSMGGAGWWLKPRMSFNAASYQLDQALYTGQNSVSRVIPTFSIDQGWVFERKTAYFGHAMLQTLEPRLLYVNTPYRDQLRLPNFDAAAKDFNFDSVYTENAFSGVDRVSDTHQLTLGVISRLSSQRDGAELLRLGVVQRVLLRDQLITPGGSPYTQKLSDLLLLGSAHVNPHWWADGTMEYSPNLGRTVRSVMSLRYSPGPFRTINATYRLVRGQSEQAELGWQWPLAGAARGSAAEGAVRKATTDGGTCAGTWYSVGRVLYSTLDRRITDSLIGFEYDAGCWIGRVVVERVSTSSSQASTRWLFQLELVGLGRLGNNPLGVLRDNIPGYRLLRDDRAALNEASYD